MTTSTLDPHHPERVVVSQIERYLTGKIPLPTLIRRLKRIQDLISAEEHINHLAGVYEQDIERQRADLVVRMEETLRKLEEPEHEKA